MRIHLKYIPLITYMEPGYTAKPVHYKNTFKILHKYLWYKRLEYGKKNAFRCHLTNYKFQVFLDSFFVNTFFQVL